MPVINDFTWLFFYFLLVNHVAQEVITLANFTWKCLLTLSLIIALLTIFGGIFFIMFEGFNEE